MIPLDATLVKGSHGRPGAAGANGPLVMSRRTELFDSDRLASVEVYDLMLRHLGVEVARPAHSI